MLDTLLLILGLLGLWVGAELTINAALNLAGHFKLSRGLVGLTLLAFATDLPELFIDTEAALQRLQGTETSGLVLGQTLGTSFSQIGIALGIVGLFGVLSYRKRTIFRDGAMLIASVVVLLFLSADGLLSRTDGAMMIVFYLFYLGMILREERIHRHTLLRPAIALKEDIIELIGGVMLLIFAADLTVKSGVQLSEALGIPQVTVGVLLVGVGTSLPEIATSITAIRKKAADMALGNLIGSNIFILFTLGVGSSISGFAVDASLVTLDIPLLLAFSLLVVLLLYRGMRLVRWESITLIIISGSYFAMKGAMLF